MIDALCDQCSWRVNFRFESNQILIIGVRRRRARMATVKDPASQGPDPITIARPYKFWHGSPNPLEPLVLVHHARAFPLYLHVRLVAVRYIALLIVANHIVGQHFFISWIRRQLKRIVMRIVGP